MEEMFQCTKCTQIKPRSEFHKRSSRPKGIHSFCKMCEKQRYKKYVNENKKSRNRSIQKWNHKNKIRLRSYWRKYNKKCSEKLYAILIQLKSKPCMDCSNSYPHYVMDFDHRDPTTKIHCVSRLLKFRTEKRLLEEVAKCDLVCANCHRIRTYARNHASECNE